LSRNKPGAWKMAALPLLSPYSTAEQDNLEEYRRGMQELGYVDGKTVETEYL